MVRRGTVSRATRRWFAESVHAAVAAAQGRGFQVQLPVVRLARNFGSDAAGLVRAVAPYTMTPPARLVALREAVEYVVRAGLPGAIVECGVWRGGSMMAVARTLIELGADDRELWLYDTYEGMTTPVEYDRTADGRPAGAWIASERTRFGGDASGVFEASLDDVRANLLSTGYPEHLLRFVAGRVEDTVSGQRPDELALLRLDTDFYESTRAELDALYSLLCEREVLILDDYGYWLGARRAVDEFFAGRPELLTRIDASGRLIVKTR